ncbi:MAG: hypothetical protein J6P61_09950 [Erysipelotrichaceae bacterium]|nr:hypothetical protein [Erysipelotrichaceae bacterium]
MQGRYGSDTLNRHLAIFALVFILIGFLFRWQILVFFADACLIFAIFRTLSRNINARYRENMKYQAMIQPVMKNVNLTKRRLSDKEHRYYKCPSCQQIVRVPRGRGAIMITCPRCHNVFEKRT